MTIRPGLAVALLQMVVLAFAASAAAAADSPKLPATEKPADGIHRLAGGQVEYQPPADWESAPKSDNANRESFVAKEHDAMLSVEVLPASMKITPDLAPEMIRKMKQTRQAKGEKFVQEPTVEKDDRFIIRIRERWQVKDKVADQVHLYRQVGSRVIVVTVNSLAGEDSATAHHEVAEKACMSAEYVKPKGK